MARQIRTYDWTTSALGSPADWPSSLRAIVDTILSHDLPMALLVGRDLINIYNDSYGVVLAKKHPSALARSERELWPDDCSARRPLMGRVEAGETIRLSDEPEGTRHWLLEDAHRRCTLSPFRSGDGSVAGVLVTLLTLEHMSDTRYAEVAEKLKREEERHTFLLGELQHRVRNILAVFQSIMRRSAPDPSTEGYVHHLEGRLGALARMQVHLTRDVDATIDLENLIRDELLFQAADETRIAITGPTVALLPKAAEVLTLVRLEALNMGNQISFRLPITPVKPGRCDGVDASTRQRQADGPQERTVDDLRPSNGTDLRLEWACRSPGFLRRLSACQSPSYCSAGSGARPTPRRGAAAENRCLRQAPTQ